MAIRLQSIDDTENINAFLDAIGGEQLPEPPLDAPVSLPSTERSRRDRSEHPSTVEDDSYVLLQLAEISKLRLLHSKHAPAVEPNQTKTFTARAPASSDSPAVPAPPKAILPSRNQFIGRISETEEVKNFQDKILASFKARFRNNQGIGETTTPPSNHINRDEARDSVSVEVDEPVAAESPTIAVTCATDSQTGDPVPGSIETDVDVGEELENREHMIHFKSWGTPPARGKPRSRVRKVILTGLPASTDLTLVQSLISGGAIDTYSLSPVGHTAYVTFTTGDACDAFYDRYPNGIAFKNEGKSYTAFVDKAKEVDVVSGMLQGHLDCGATRCVRAVNVDEDWGMRALHRLAEGVKKNRKVEKIIDSFANGVRSVVFRFTSISDAVALRAALRRSVEWEDVRVEFVRDPCEMASGVHME